MYIIFDSNIWISELGLNSAKGAAVRFFAKNRGATVVVPEVVKLEAERHLKSELERYVAELQKNHRQLLTVFGTLKELVLPDTRAIEEKVSSVFGKCEVELMDAPLTIESAMSAFLRTVDKIPPSDKDQQFKDGVIWFECVHLLETDDVHLVTADKAFYKGRQYENGLADALAIEIKHAKHALSISPTLSALLTVIKSEVSVDKKSLVAQFWESNRQSIEGLLQRSAFNVVGDPTVAVDLYVTETPNRLYAEFCISYSCEDITSDGRTDGVLLLRGDGTYSIQEKQFSAMRNHGEELSFKTKEHEDKSIHNIVIFAADLVIGHKTVEHAVKFKLEA
ncbi:MAG: PIN domain-containing protein [Candidatus Vecturithrix sp.]|jgi:hypothetical protein|nr:PIN domain-containing protein [Candidatus Vecturithrix sp.]